MKTITRILFCPLIALMIAAPITGCSSTATQAQITTGVQDVQKWAPVVIADISALSTDVATFSDPADQQVIQVFLTKLQADAPQLQTLCNAYLAAPSATLLTQITSLIGSLATTDSQALLSILSIKSSSSQATVKAVLVTLATAFTILQGIAVTWSPNSAALMTSPNSVKLATIRPFLDKEMLSSALNEGKSRGEVSQYATVNLALDKMQNAGL